MIRNVAAIDCGTNSLRLLIAQDGPNGLVDVVRLMHIVRLGQGVDETGLLHPEALARVGTALEEYAALIASAGVSAVRMVATSAARDAGNRDEFEAIVARTVGCRPEIVSGLEEARLSFTGACAALPVDVGPVIVADIGGGSTEIVAGVGGHVKTAVSLDVGSVRLTERHVRADPPSAAERSSIVDDVTAQLARVSAVPADAQLVGVAGTITTLAAAALGLNSYQSERIEGVRLSRAHVEEAVDAVVGMTQDQRLATGVIHPGRADVIAAGALILSTLMAHLQAPDIVVTEHDILDGIAAGLARS